MRYVSWAAFSSLKCFFFMSVKTPPTVRTRTVMALHGFDMAVLLPIPTFCPSFARGLYAYSH